MKKIMYVNGAGASKTSFKWIEDSLPEHHKDYFEYKVDEGLQGCITRLSKQIDGPLIVIGHSLGGLIAAGVTDHPLVTTIITMCAPFGGLEAAPLLALLRPDQIFRDLSPLNFHLRTIRTKLKNTTKPKASIIATSGMPMLTKPNDGVVSVESQMSAKLSEDLYKVISLNHFEVLMSQQSVDLIKSFME